MQQLDIDTIIGKRFNVVSMRRFPVLQRKELYVRGVVPGKEIQLIQVSPLGDPLIIWVDRKKFAINRIMWGMFDLEEVAACPR